MEKLYKLKEEVFQYVSKTSETCKVLTLKDWLDKGYNTSALEVVSNNHFELGHRESDSCTSMSHWGDGISQFYFTLFLTQDYKAYNLFTKNSTFKKALIREMNNTFNNVYDKFKNKDNNIK